MLRNLVPGEWLMLRDLGDTGLSGKSWASWNDLVTPHLFVSNKKHSTKYLWYNVYLNSNLKKALYKSYKHSLTLLFV